MQDPRLADHAVGLELQLSELVEQRERALVQHRQRDADELEGSIAAVTAELAQTADRLAAEAEVASVHDAVTARPPEQR